MEIKQNLVDKSKYNIKCPYSMQAEFIVVHNTANDASAKNEVAYMVRNDNTTSFHFAVDDKEVWQGIPLDRNAWHAGDGRNGKGNRKGIGIEICYSKSGGSKFSAAEKNAVKLIAQLLKERNWGVDKVKTHKDMSQKYCPHRTLDLGWDRFVNMIKTELGEATPLPSPTPSNTIKADDVVKIKTGARYTTGKIVPFWVRAKNWIVKSVNGNRAIIDKSQDGKNSIASPIDVKYLEVVTVKPAPTGIASTGVASDEKLIWDFFCKKIGNEYGVAGLMGNLYAESSLKSNNLQQAYEKKLGYTDVSYTAAVDNGSYNNFVRDSAGYGLAQWTFWSRKENLLKYVTAKNKSIGDLTTQMEFLWEELSTSYKAVLNDLKNAKSVLDASNSVLTKFERPANQGEAVKKKRVEFGQKYYNKYATKQAVVEKSYMVQVTAKALNVRSGPGVTNKIVTTIRDQGAYTIVDEKNGWGLLKQYDKNRNGWIHLSYTKKI